VAVVVERKKGEETIRSFVSVRAEASRMIGELPPNGAEFYRATIGPVAAQALKNAEGDPKALALIMHRYLYTEAGAAATEQLATHLLDRGQFSTAALYFEKLMQRAGMEKLSPQTLFKAAIAFHRVNSKANEDKVWKYLEAKSGGNLELAQGKVYSLEKLKEWVASRKSVANNKELQAWVMDGGDPSRSAQGIGTTAFLEAIFKKEFGEKDDGTGTIENTTKNYLTEAIKYLDNKNLPHLHSFSPIAVSVTRDDGKIPLMVYRSFWGIHARVVRKTHLNKDEKYEAGELYWEAPSNWSIDKMARNNQHVGAITQWMQMYQNNGQPPIILDPSLPGPLSTDGVRVFAIEDFTIPPYNQNTPFGGGRPGGVGSGFEQKLNDALYHNRLQAYELDSGKLLWEAGGTAQRATPEGLEDTYFLSPPLPLNGKLYVLGEMNQELRLLCLDAATGKLVSKQRLADTREKILVDVGRRLHASQLAYGEGI